uniref:Variant surface glycoprotein 546 n=1 Tax=Trypanosoma brucei TaxID=5691 RepID=M4SYC3_9TRYP|nr:variant surface glycoprotein 546 [Trypanosoma brucei]
MPYSTIPTLLLIFNAATTCTANKANDPAAEAATDVCKEHAYLTRLSQHIQGKLNDIKATIRLQKTEARKWRMAAAKAQEQGQKCLLTALELTISDALEANELELERVRKTVNSATTAIKQQQGVIAAALAVSAVHAKMNSGSVHSSTGGGSPYTATLKLVKAKSEDLCKLETDEAKETFGGETPEPQDLFKLDLTDKSKVNKANQLDGIKITAEGGCTTQNSQSATGALNACSFSGASGAVEITKAKPPASAYRTATHFFKSNEDKTACHSDITAADAANEPLKRRAKAICEGVKLTPNTTKISEYSGKSLSGSHAIRTYVRNCWPAFHNIDDPTDNSKAKELIKWIEKGYGETADNFNDKFKSLLEGESTPIRDKGEVESKKITELTSSTAKTNQAVSAMEAIRIKRELEAEKKNIPKAIDTKKSEECKGEKDETKCSSKDGCEYKDGECKVKATTAATGTDGKATNTTVSNSFVIHKAPLLLAFLIL